MPRTRNNRAGREWMQVVTTFRIGACRNRIFFARRLFKLLDSGRDVDAGQHPEPHQRLIFVATCFYSLSCDWRCSLAPMWRTGNIPRRVDAAGRCRLIKVFPEAAYSFQQRARRDSRRGESAPLPEGEGGVGSMTWRGRLSRWPPGGQSASCSRSRCGRFDAGNPLRAALLRVITASRSKGFVLAWGGGLVILPGLQSGTQLA